MPWKSRIGKEPPATFYAQAAAYAARAHDGIAVTREVMQTLKPFLAEAWREGNNAKKAVEATCACDGKTIVPSPAVSVRLVKGEVRPPQGAQRGEVFGAAELRESVDLTRLRQQLAAAQAQLEQATDRADRATGREQQARSPESRAKAAQRVYEALAQKKESLTRVANLEKKIAEYLAVQERERARLVRAHAAPIPETQPTASAPPAHTSPPSRKPTPPAADSPKPASKGDGAKPTPRRKKTTGAAGLPATTPAVSKAVSKLLNPEDL